MLVWRFYININHVLIFRLEKKHNTLLDQLVDNYLYKPFLLCETILKNIDWLIKWAKNSCVRYIGIILRLIIIILAKVKQT